MYEKRQLCKDNDNLIRVFRELDRYGPARVINKLCQFFPKEKETLNGRGYEKIVFEHLEQLASPNLDSDSKELVFDRIETLYNTVVSVRWDNIYAVAK